MNKPFSQACENNKEAILSILTSAFSNTQQVLEIGSGSGQHAVHFARYFNQAKPNLIWHTSDLLINHSGINSWIDDQPSPNLRRPILVDLNSPWPLTDPLKSLDGIFTANTLHIVSWPLVQRFFQGVEKTLTVGGRLCIYGPFNYHGKFTSQSNANFDLWLKDRDVQSGIRDFEAINDLAIKAGLKLLEDNEMPANNRLLVFSKH